MTRKNPFLFRVERRDGGIEKRGKETARDRGKRKEGKEPNREKERFKLLERSIKKNGKKREVHLIHGIPF